MKDGRLTYGVVRVGPWRRKEWLPARIEVILKDDLNELAADPLPERLRDALLNDVRGTDVYSVGRHNCRNFAQREFDAVPANGR